MASNFIPMLSSSPPPLDDNGSIEDDDEDFGDFATASQVLDSPLDSPVKTLSNCLNPNETEELIPPLDLSNATKSIERIECVQDRFKNFETEQEIAKENGLKVNDLLPSKISPLCNGELSLTNSTHEILEHIPADCSASEIAHGENTFRTVSFSVEPAHSFSDEDNDDDDDEDEETLTHSKKCSLNPKYDNISQESVSDSGLCSSSQWSDSSPLPALSSDVSPEEEQLSKENLEQPTTGGKVEDEMDNQSVNYERCNGNSASPEQRDSCSMIQENETDQHVRDYLDSLPNIPETIEVSRFSSDIDREVPQCDSDVISDHLEDDEMRPPAFAIDEEEDDFADFESAFEAEKPPNLSEKIELPVENKKDLKDKEVVAEETLNNENAEDVEDDSFADFACADFPSADFASADFASADFANADFAGTDFVRADFSSVSFGDFQSDENQWADFETGVQDEQSASVVSIPNCRKDAESLHKQLLPNEILQRIASAFPPVNEDNSKPVDSISPNLLGALSSSSHTVWALLEDLDQSLSLRYQWTGSETFQKTLHSLNIDSRNIEYIPPAQFDWNSSGLVNPLDPSQVSSTLLDLDFFVTSIASSSSKSITKTFSLEEELLGHQLEPPNGISGPTDSSSHQNVILEKLLSTMKSTHCSTLPRQQQRPTNLSETTVQILDRIPDLSYMRAKVLMFPVRSQQQES